VNVTLSLWVTQWSGGPEPYVTFDWTGQAGPVHLYGHLTMPVPAQKDGADIALAIWRNPQDRELWRSLATWLVQANSGGPWRRGLFDLLLIAQSTALNITLEDT
jgi:hypothetical protein